MLCLFVGNVQHILRYNRTLVFIFCIQKTILPVYLTGIKHCSINPINRVLIVLNL